MQNQKQPRIYRGSEAPIAMICPASVHPEPGEMVIDSVNDAALVGTATHECCRVMVDTHRIPDFKEVLKPFNLTQTQFNEVKMLTFAAWNFWEQHFEAFGGGVETEKALRFGQLSAHLDVSSLPFNDEDEPDLAYVLDWKTTRLDVNYTPQLLFYAWLMLLSFDKIHRVKTVIVYLRDRTADIREWNGDQIHEFGKQFHSTVIMWPERAEKVYRPGGHCGYCRRFTSCPAQKSMIWSTHQALIQSEDINLPVEPDKLIHLYERVGALSKRIDQFKSAVRAKVEHDGIIQGTDKRLVFVNQNRDTIAPKEAWPILTKHLTDDELADSITVSKGSVLDYVGKKAARGQKKAEKDAFMEELRNAGAVETKEIQTMRLLQGQEKEAQISES